MIEIHSKSICYDVPRNLSQCVIYIRKYKCSETTLHKKKKTQTTLDINIDAVKICM